ncbi:MAG: hypothetical protein WBF99_12170 [Xanthobacteraceae bacterium]
MSRRIYIGVRDGVPGLYVSKPGYDAKTAGAANMLLTMSQRYSNLLKLGMIDGSGSVVLGYGAKPFVTITGISDLTGLSNIVIPANAKGPIRPSPPWLRSDVGDQSAYATLASDGSTMSITAPIRVWYSVYSRVLA